MYPRLIAALILTPFALTFIYAAIHEYLRYRSEGRADYRLIYDHETGTTHVAAIGEDGDGFDPSEFNPKGYKVPDIRTETGDKRS